MSAGQVGTVSTVGAQQDWSHGGRVQVIQQPLQQLQNPTYVHQLYSSPQGQLLMPGNLLHSNINPQQIQVITANKPFQGGQIAPHMLTTAQGKQVLAASSANGFNGGYSLPTIPSTQSQTLLFSPLNVISSQPSILSTHNQNGKFVSKNHY